MAISESPLKDATLMAIAEINQAGGVLGKTIKPVIEDGASNPLIFERKARKLLKRDRVATIFGLWSSACRRLVLPVLEDLNGLLWYPTQYEGLECSENIFYTGSCPNQQVLPAVNWLLQHKGRRFYLLGMDYVFPRVANRIIKVHLKQHQGEVIGEDYPALGTTEFQAIIQKIKRTKPDAVFSTLNGDGNLAFYQQYRDAGLTADKIPVMAVSISEAEIQQMKGAATGHYATWSYFQSTNTPANRKFVQSFKAMYGQDRVTSDPIEAAYVQVYLWKQVVEAAQSFDPKKVREVAYGQSFDAPGGKVWIDGNHHLWKGCRIGEIMQDGQFKSIAESKEPIKPLPWMGAESANFKGSSLVIDLLSEVAQGIQDSCQVVEKSRELESALAELVSARQVDLLKRSLSQQIRRSLELDTILSTAVSEIRNLFHIDRCSFFWCKTDSEPYKCELAHVVCNPALLGLTSGSSIALASMLSQTIRQRTLLQIDDVAEATARDPESYESLVTLRLSALLAAPIRTHSDQIGAIVCEHYSGHRPWSDSEVDLLRDVADQLAIAIDQAELYRQARAAAHDATAKAEQLTQALHDLQQTQSQLIQAEKMSSLGQLVAGVAHEINNPVSFISGNLKPAREYAQELLDLLQLYQQEYPQPSQTLQDALDDLDIEFIASDFPKLLASMEIGTDRIRQIVLSLRNFSRLDEEGFKPANIHEGIDSTLLILQNRLKAVGKRASIQVIQDYADLPLVECHAGQLNQVFMNILANAIDALDDAAVGDRWAGTDTKRRQAENNGHHDGPTIHIQTELVGSDWVKVRIADNGLGMTPDVQQRLFDPFFTSKPVGKGTGLGLSISYQIVVERHSGRLNCLSALGEGAEFSIEIPVIQSESDPMAGDASADGQVSIASQQKNSPTSVTEVDDR